VGNGIFKNVKYLFECVMEVIYWGDEKCIICKNDIYQEKCLCRNCNGKIRECVDSSCLTYENIKIKCYSSAYYSKTIRELVIKLKYKKDYKSAEVLSELMLKVIERNSLEADFITFVPVSRGTMKKRGYNQSELLAKIICNEVEIKLIDSLKKVKDTKDQIGLGKKGRWENIRNNFELRKNIDIQNKSFILVDDVVTTGATAFWCAYTLLKNGAGKVIVLTAAKSRV